MKMDSVLINKRRFNMKKAKRNAVIILLLFALITAGLVYSVLEGL